MRPEKVTRRTGCGFALAVGLFLTGIRPHLCGAATPEEATQTCRQQLRFLAEALGNYRQDHNGAFPIRLGDLSGDYVSEPTMLQCPEALEQGKAGTADEHFVDPSKRDGRVVGYTWERSPEDQEGWDRTRWGMSFAKFKDLQYQSLVGKYVPVIRCSHHGKGHVLNLTVAGTIYESGEYWECCFVDQLSYVRSSPLLVAQADRPMSALVRPRPAWATEAMLDLRSWYNARFEDPWVNGEPEMERLRPDQELGSGVITNRGVAFDAAGIIQLNGKVGTNGTWDAYDRLAYPKAVRSININRAFRVMHVLGGVQFADPRGVGVATIQIYRTGSLPETWSWRYGVDVLNYRFTPGQAEPRLESAAVAWTGEFAGLEAQERREKPRLFHLRYVTANPDTVVDHLDFLAGEGVSSPFIVAITLE